MRLAFLTSLIPVARPDTGFEIANAAVLDALREAGHEVTAFGFLRPGETPSAPEGAVVIGAFEIENAAVGTGTKLNWIAQALRRGLPIACAKLRLEGEGKLVEAVRAKGPFDAIVLNSVMLPGAFPELLTLGPCVLVEHNIEHASARENARHAGSLPMRWLFAREARLLERIERRLWEQTRFVWTLAAEDRAALGPALQARSAVLPLVSAHNPATGPGVEPPVTHDIGLIGTWTWMPNFIGLDWFLREVCPLLPNDISIAVAGRLPPDMPPVSANVTLAGRVPNADAFLRACRIVALSSRAGTGVQLKTDETMQLGLPAVATGLSLRGFTEVPPNFSRADTAEAFAQALVERIAQIRAGDPQRSDGAAFVASQRAELMAALEQGLAAARR